MNLLFRLQRGHEVQEVIDAALRGPRASKIGRRYISPFVMLMATNAVPPDNIGVRLIAKTKTSVLCLGKIFLYDSLLGVLHGRHAVYLSYMLLRVCFLTRQCP